MDSLAARVERIIMRAMDLLGDKITDIKDIIIRAMDNLKEVITIGIPRIGETFRSVIAELNNNPIIKGVGAVIEGVGGIVGGLGSILRSAGNALGGDQPSPVTTPTTTNVGVSNEVMMVKNLIVQSFIVGDAAFRGALGNAGFSMVRNGITGELTIEKKHTGGVIPMPNSPWMVDRPRGTEVTTNILGGEVVMSPPKSEEFANNIRELTGFINQNKMELPIGRENQITIENNEVILAMERQEKLLNDLLQELKKNTEVTDKKELVVDSKEKMITSANHLYQGVS